MEPTLVRQIEELSMNALPALQTVLYDGWILRFANGYSRRANSINPLYQGAHNIEEKITACEGLFQAKKQKVVFKLTPSPCPANLDEVLASKGYVEEGRTSVQLTDLTRVPEPSHAAQISDSLTSEWFDNYCKMNQVEDRYRHTLEQMLPNITGKIAFTSLVRDGKVVACGLGVLEGFYVGIYDIVTDPSWRNQGLGHALVLNILSWAEHNGAQTAYLQVVATNEPALRLYSKLGFREAYQYWYRTQF
jgi:ribosomal protein S18 acetylase RimI-like enzyme